MPEAASEWDGERLGEAGEIRQRADETDGDVPGAQGQGQGSQSGDARQEPEGIDRGGFSVSGMAYLLS